MLNKVMLIGNLGKDPEIRHFEGGSKVCKFPIATNENFQDKNGEWQTRTEWHDIVCWGNQAERAEKSLRKGNLIFVEGKISKRKWQDKEGNDRYTTEIRCVSYKSLERKDSTSSSLEGEITPSVEEQFSKTNISQNTSTAGAPEDDLPF